MKSTISGCPSLANAATNPFFTYGNISSWVFIHSPRFSNDPIALLRFTRQRSYPPLPPGISDEKYSHDPSGDTAGYRSLTTCIGREPNSNTGVEIYTAQRSDAKWSDGTKYEITADTLSNYGHPAVSPDGSWLYFSSDMPGGSGGYDLWRVNLKSAIGSLENLGEWINTQGMRCFRM